MAQDFECPNCGAPIDYYNPDKPTVRCQYCGKTVIVPAELRAQTPQTLTIDLSPNISETPISPGARRWFGWGIGAIVFFVICSVVIPLIGAAVGIGAALTSVNQVITGSGNARATIIAFVTDVPEPTETPSPSRTPTPQMMNVALRFGSEGTGPGHFNDARSIAVDNVGNIYVGDYQGGRVQVFDPSGKFLSQFGVGNSRSLLYSLAADRKGIVYVVANGQIQRWQGATGKQLTPIQYSGGDRFAFATTTADGGLLATWYEERNGLITSIEGHRDDLVRFDASGNVVKVFPRFLSAQTGDPELETEVAPDGLGSIFALGGEFGRAVFKFTPEGKFVNKFGSVGNAPDQFQSPSAIAVDGKSRVYIGDSERILIFEANGRYIDTVRLDDLPDAMVFNDKDELFIAARTVVLKLVPTQK